MTDSNDSQNADALRERAEALVRARSAGLTPPAVSGDVHRLIHELQVHQVELEFQNESLRESRDEIEIQRARYTALYDSAPSGFVTLSPDGTIAESNRAAAALLDRESMSLAGRRFGMFVDDTTRPAFNEFLSQTFATSEPQRCELAIGRGEGPKRVVLLEGRRGPKPNECQASLSDITARRRAEAALRLRDRAVRAVSQGLIITDAQAPGQPIIYTNPGFELLTGYSAKEAAGRNCRFLQGKGTSAESVLALRKAVERGEPCTVELLNYRKDGSVFWNALFITPVRDDDGTLVQFVGVLADMTEQRALERSLRQAQRLEAVGRLAGGIAHDFNNLLTVIIGGTSELGADLAPSDPRQPLLQDIAKSGERAASLTHQLLAFSRAQSLEPTVVDLSAMVSDLSGMLRQLLGGTTEMRIALDALPARVRVDPEQISQVLVNLVVNARDAMPKGGFVTVRTMNVEEDGARRAGHLAPNPGASVLLEVTDSGSGMDAEAASHVFEPFFSPARKGVGAGLGLAMVYGMITQSEGQITVRSAPGLGSTYSICLPSANGNGVGAG